MKNSLHEQQFTGLKTLTPERQKSASSIGSASALKFPEDMAEANAAVGAACGHFALAASLGLNVMDVVQNFPGLSEGKSWCSVNTMERALQTASVKWQAVGVRWPAVGVVIVQGIGSWMKPGVPFGARLSRTHWIAVKGDLVADANAARWLTRAEWGRTVLHEMLGRWRAEGWEVKRGYEVTQNVRISDDAP